LKKLRCKWCDDIDIVHLPDYSGSTVSCCCTADMECPKTEGEEKYVFNFFCFQNLSPLSDSKPKKLEA